ncbi:MAG: type II secretion system F family protein [Candidatus Omnitrophica bacterium]|nr:type II secretion system F family protein [Candidatus Omnitrophota bacterium]
MADNKTHAQVSVDALKRELSAKRLFARRGVTAKQLVVFTRELATLMGAGLPLVKSIRTLETQMEPGTLKEALEKVTVDITGGESFSESLAKHGKVFPRLFTNMVRAGELGGVLEGVLKRLAEFLEKQERLRGKIKSALMYPIFVLTIAGLILILLMVFVIPTFTSMFEELGGELPIATRLLIATSDFLRNFWYLAILLVAGIIFGLRAFVRAERFRLPVDRFKLKIPLFGPLIRQIAVAQFARTFGTLLNSGVPVLGALTIVRETGENRVLAQAITRVHDSVREGEGITKPLEASGFFPQLVAKMIGVGEESGELDQMLIRIADTYEEEIDQTVSGLTALLEPIMIVVMGLIVGFIVVAMFLPLFTLAKLMG